MRIVTLRFGTARQKMVPMNDGRIPTQTPTSYAQPPVRGTIVYKPIAEFIDQLNRKRDFAILSTAKTNMALSRFKGLRALTDGVNRDT
jgi:hypothetical protein